MVDELKPCPFCGGKAAASSCGACGFDLYIFVKCETCGARTMRFQADDTDHFWDQPAAQMASEFWNRRVVAQNIRVGKWLDNYRLPVCSICGNAAPYKDQYCSNCGAKMSEEGGSDCLKENGITG